MIFARAPITEAGFYEFRRVGDEDGMVYWCWPVAGQVFVVRASGQPWPLIADGWEWRKVPVPEGVE